MEKNRRLPPILTCAFGPCLENPQMSSDARKARPCISVRILIAARRNERGAIGPNSYRESLFGRVLEGHDYRVYDSDPLCWIGASKTAPVCDLWLSFTEPPISISLATELASRHPVCHMKYGVMDRP